MIVLDTHVWVWWIDDSPRLRPEVRDRIDSETDVRLSAISLLEIATATSLGRMTLVPSAKAWLEVAQSVEQVRVMPLTDAVCLESVSLPGDFHRDPADRLIVALARQLDADLITADHKILAYPFVRAFAAE